MQVLGALPPLRCAHSPPRYFDQEEKPGVGDTEVCQSTERISLRSSTRSTVFRSWPRLST